MESKAQLFRPSARYAWIYLIYLAVAARTFLFLQDDPDQGRILGLLLAYGGVFAAAHLIRGQAVWLKAGYLLVQSAWVVAILPNDFRQDFFVLLFLPLGLQAMVFFGAPRGYAWLAGTIVCIAGLTGYAWQWRAMAIPSVILFGGAMVFVGVYANLNRQAETQRNANQARFKDLSETYQRLEEAAKQSESYARVQERNRMARELHDSATQTIFSMNLTVQAARMLAERDPARMGEQLEKLQTLASYAVSEIQELSTRLRAIEGGEAADLGEELRRMAVERERREGLKIRVAIDRTRLLDPAVARGLVGITVEALNNIQKHSGVKEADLRLRLESGAGMLEIADQGRGFDANAVERGFKHMGLQEMEERAMEIGWRLSVLSAPGAGTIIRVEEGNR